MKSVNSIPTFRPEEQINKIIANNSHVTNPKVNDFLIHNVSGYHNKLNLPSKPHRKTVNDFVVVTNGSLVKTSGIDSYRIEKKSVFILSAGQIRAIEGVSKDIEGYYCHFSNDFIVENNPHFTPAKGFSFLDKVGTPLIEIPSGEFETIVVLLRRMEAIYRTTLNFELIRSYLLTILQEFKTLALDQSVRKSNAAEVLTQSFKQLMMEHIHTIHSVEQYADLLNVSSNHLNKSVKLVTGKTASSLVNELIVLEAKVLLYQPQISIGELSYAIGFEDPSYFGRFFKKNTGKTPTEFRAMIDLSE